MKSSHQWHSLERCDALFLLCPWHTSTMGLCPSLHPPRMQHWSFVRHRSTGSTNMTGTRSLRRRTRCLDCIWDNDHKSLLYTARETVHPATRRNELEAMSKCHHPTATSDKNQKDKLSEITHEDWNSSATFLIVSTSSSLSWRSDLIVPILSSSKSLPIDTENKPSTVDDDDGADRDSSIKSTDRRRGDPRWSPRRSLHLTCSNKQSSRHDKTVRPRQCDNVKKPKVD